MNEEVNKGAPELAHYQSVRWLLEDRLLKVSAVAEGLNVSTATVYSLIKKGDLACERIGRLIRIKESEVERYLGLPPRDSRNN